MGFKSRKTSTYGQLTSRWGSLTDREREAALHIMRGDLSRAEMCAAMECTDKTLDSHRLNLMTKMDTTSNVQLVHFGVRLGLVSSNG